MRHRSLALLCAAWIGASPIAFAADPPAPLAVDWMYGDDADRMAAMPRTAWTADGDLLLLDRTRPEAERTLERVRVPDGTRGDAVDAARALASLADLRGEAGAPEGLDWPVHLSADGGLGVYVFDGDLFVLDLAASSFRRVTATPETESLPRFSPDGAKLAFVRDADLVVVDLATGEEFRRTADGSDTVRNGKLSYVYEEEIFDRDARGYWWSPDSRSIAFLRSDDGPVSTMVYKTFEAAVPDLIHQRYPKAGGDLPDVTLGIIGATSGTARFVSPDAMPYAWLVGIEWTPDASRLAVQTLNRAQDRLDLYLVAADDATPTRILTERDEAWSNQHEIEFLEDGSRFVWTSERTGHTHLYLYEADGTLVRALTAGDWSVRGPQSFTGSPLDAVFLDEERDEVRFTALEASPVERHLYRVGLDGTGMARVTREPGVHGVDVRPGGGAWVDVHSDRCTPPVARLRIAAGDRTVELARARTELLGDLDWRCAEVTTIPAADGFPLPARILKPAGFDATRPHPLVLYVYGGPSAPAVRDAWAPQGVARALFEQRLLHEGFVVASVDPRSATGISKTLQNPVRGKVWSDVELDDFVAAIRWFKAQPWIDGERVGMWGWSGGGTSTLLTLTRSRELRAGISVAPVTDWRYYDAKFTEAYMGTPADNPDGYEHTSLVARAKDLHGRLLLVHGTYDDNVHPQNTWAFVDALVEADVAFDLMVYPMRKHGIRDDAARIHLHRKMLAFWERELR
jgi:dipeptidyl-peptidase-4